MKQPAAGISRSRLFLAIAVVGSLTPPLLGAYGLVAFLGSRYWPHAVAVTWYAFSICALTALAVRVGWRTNALLALAVFHLLILSPEIFLRLADFRHEPGIQFGYARTSKFLRLAIDKDLFWTLPPDRPGVNAQGFRTYALPRKQAPGLACIVVLGDSVPFLGYPEIVEALLNARGEAARRYEVVNLSLAGYSSHQGRVLSQKYGDLLPADVVVIHYGWNDHWLARGSSDAEKTLVIDRSAAARMRSLIYRRIRLLQALRFVIGTGKATGEEAPAGLRVPPERYRENLVFLGDFWTRRGARILLLTAPSSYARLGVPDYLVRDGYASDKTSAESLHRNFNQIVRSVAADHGWPMLDLAADFAALEPPLLEQIFTDDGIHPTPTGTVVVGVRIAAAIPTLIDRDVPGARRTLDPPEKGLPKSGSLTDAPR